MQRSISDQKSLTLFIYIIVFIIYSSLSSIYPSLPPLFSLLFIMFSRALDRKEILYTVVVSFLLIIFEANFGYFLFSSIIYFYLVQRFFIPKLIQNFSCPLCIKISYVLLAYIGYFLFLTLISSIFLLPVPTINYYIIYYIIIEFFLVAIL